MLHSYLAEQARTLLRYQPPALKRTLWFIGGCALLMGIVELGVAGLVSLLGASLASPAAILDIGAVRTSLARFPVLAALAQNPSVLLTMLMGCVVFGVITKNSLLALLTYKQNRYAHTVAALLGEALFTSYMRGSYLWHLDKNAEELTTTMYFRTHAATFLISLLALSTQAMIALCLLGGGLALAPLPTIIVFGVTGVAAVVIYKFSRRRATLHNTVIAETLVEVNKDINAGLQGIRDVQVYRREQAMCRRVSSRLTAVIPDYAVSSTLSAVPSWCLESIGMVMLLIALALMTCLEVSLARVTGTLALLAAIAWRLLPCMNKTVAAIVELYTVRPYLQKFFTMLGQAETNAREGEDSGQPGFQKHISLENVTFRYPKAAVDALQALSMNIRKGQVVGVVGTSGAGKSTLIGVLTGLLWPDSGCMRVDDAVLRGGACAGLRSLVGLVPQSPYLMDASLAANVAFSRFGEPIEENRVLEACRMAALDFWEQLPDGIHTVIGERGVKLSGGQAQRIAIARALYAKPQLLIFDEATSALDTATEEAIQKTILSLRGDVTLVIIAHRLTTVEDCDVIYWLDNGRLRGNGPPEKILAAYTQYLTQEQ